MNLIKALNYNIVFEQENYTVLTDFLKQTSYSNLFILVDEHTKKYCLSVFLLRISFDYKIITIPAGENHKNLETCTSVWNELNHLKADRQSILINIGGGMLTDIGGFIASTFKRGIRFINVSTSLLGMVDASVGGKTGIDFNGLKNQIGLFSNPEMVIIDTDYLSTLPQREVNSGMSEIIKYGLTYDLALWNTLKTNDYQKSLTKIIYRAIEIKNEIVLKDPKEQYLRKILNYGHTIGHAIETFFLNNDTKSTLTHGEAVAIGLICETYISTKLYKFPKSELEILKKYINNLFGKFNFDTSEFNSIIELMKHDKKNINGEIRFVLLDNIADCKIDCSVNQDLIIEALNYYLL